MSKPHACHSLYAPGHGGCLQEQGEATAEPGDLDIGVRFDGPVRLLEVVNLLVDVTGYDDIDVAVVTGEHPVLDAEAMGGIPLYERGWGAFADPVTRAAVDDAVRTVGDGFPAYITAVARYLEPS